MPGMICSVASCRTNSTKARETGEKVTFFTFPKNEEIRKEWIRRCKRKEDFNPVNKRICSKHFLPEDYEDRIKASIMNVRPKKLKERAIPSLNLEEDETQRKISRPTQTTNGHKTDYSEDRFNGDFEIIYITGAPEDEESDYEILQRKYNDLLEENKHLKQLLNKYLTEEWEKISVRRKRVVNDGKGVNETDQKKRKVVKGFDMKHFSKLYSNNKS